MPLFYLEQCFSTSCLTVWFPSGLDLDKDRVYLASCLGAVGESGVPQMPPLKPGADGAGVIGDTAVVGGGRGAGGSTTIGPAA